MKITYISPGLDNTHSKPFVGFGYYIGESLKKNGAGVNFITEGFKAPFTFFYKIKSFIYKFIFKKKYLRIREPLIYKKFAWYIENTISEIETDVVFSFGTLPVAFLDIEKPIIIWTDISFAGLVDFYEDYKNLCNETLSKGHFLEQQAFDKSSIIIFSSDWAAQRAITTYNLNPSKVKVVPFGPLIPVDRDYSDIKKFIEVRKNKKLNLLFIGGEWDRKNGDLAVKIVKEINSLGYSAVLNILGSTSGNVLNNPEMIIVHGYLDKSVPADKQKIEKLFAESHFLILPTKADCIPSVILEANSYGLPCISTKVGGIPEVIKRDINGRLFDLKDDALAYAQYIINKYNDFDDYTELALNTFEEYLNNLNWKISGKKVMDLINENLKLS